MRSIASCAVCAALSLLFLFCTHEKNAGIARGPMDRIVSLSPSITRQIIDCEAGDRVVGVTSYDDFHPKGVTIIGTIMQPNIEKIVELKPDIVLFSEEDNPVQNCERLENAGIRYHQFPSNKSFTTIGDNYLLLGSMLKKEAVARKKIMDYTADLAVLKRNAAEGMTCSAGAKKALRPLVAFFLSQHPLVAASNHCFIGQILADAGAVCAYENSGRPYPLVSVESLVELNPDVIISMTGDKDAGTFFFSLLGDFKNLKVIAHRTIYNIDPDTISFYTPCDYVKSVKKIMQILCDAAGKH